jgi:aminopeptidase N
MMWNPNYAGNGYQTYSKAPATLSMLGGIVGDEAVIAAMKKYAEVWKFKHPSPWDYLFFMNNELGQNLKWFWYYWLWTTEAVEGSIQNVKMGSNTEVTIQQTGEMPLPVVLKVEFEAGGPAIKAMKNA